jgi:hypothetical protein
MFPVRVIILGMFVSIAANGGPIEFQSSESQVALVELYTSEGCSSCPPADSWLSRLKEAPGLWSNFVPVAFHVDYWDYLGWRDKWSSKQYSDRQREYAGTWGSENIYTPEFVLNGKEWHNWLGLKGAPGVSKTKAGVLKVTSEDTNHWQVQYIPAIAGVTAFEINAALLVSGLGSEVKAGENVGRHLRHDFVVLKLIRQPLIGKDGGFQGIFTLVAGPCSPECRLALAAWATRSGSLEPAQSVGGWLVASEKNK